MKHDPWMGIGWNMMSLVEQKHIALGWEFVILRLLNSYISRAIIITCMVIQSFFPQTKSESHCTQGNKVGPITFVAQHDGVDL